MSITSPANAKNVLSVGASEGWNPENMVCFVWVSGICVIVVVDVSCVVVASSIVSSRVCSWTLGRTDAWSAVLCGYVPVSGDAQADVVVSGRGWGCRCTVLGMAGGEAVSV